MADDSFIREVDEQIRQDRARDLWSRYGRIIIALAVLVVVATAALRGWDYYSASQAEAAGDRWLEAIELSNGGNHDAALEALEEVVASGVGQYPALARMRMASEMAAKGEAAEAMAAFDAIAADGAYDQVFRDMARLRAGLLAVDTESLEAVRARLEPLAGPGASFRHSAREAVGIAAIKAGELLIAHDQFSAIANDAGAASGVRDRAALMLDYLAGRGVTGEEAAGNS